MIAPEKSVIHIRALDLLLTDSCEQQTTQSTMTYLWFIIPQLLNGLSSLLVSMTVFEFICAQAPRTTQGLLIGACGMPPLALVPTSR